MTVDVSAIIATKNRHECLLELLSSISSLEPIPKEIIIVDGSGVRAHEAELTSRFGTCADKPNVIYHHFPNSKGLTNKRNIGVRSAESRFLQFLDDDVELPENYFERILPLFDDHEVGGVSCLITEKQKSRPLLKALFYRIFFLGCFRQQREEVGLHLKRGLPITSNILPGTAIYRREVCEQFTFDENLQGSCLGEDVEFSFRVSTRWKLLIHCGVSVLHHRSDTERSSLKQNIKAKIAFYHYHFLKNIHPSFKNKILFTWLMFGVSLSALAKPKVEAWKGLFSGLKSLMNKEFTGANA